MTRPIRHTAPGELCRIRPPTPADEDARPRGTDGGRDVGHARGVRYETGPDEMIQDINESVTVLIRFSGGQMDPLRFKWRSKVFDVDRVTGRWEEHEGHYKLHHFAVVTKDKDYYELVYDTRTMGWTLTRTDLEG